MIANFGYQDGSGEYFISIATDKCNGCGDCRPACQAQVFEVRDEDTNDPFREIPVAVFKESKRKKYACGPCKPVSNQSPLPCVGSCKARAIVHSWQITAVTREVISNQIKFF